MRARRDAAGQFGPDAYAQWRSVPLGTLTEQLERRLILRLAGEVAGAKVLDGGCGDGALDLAFCQGAAALVVGCDIDARMVARASAGAAQPTASVDYLLADARRLPFADGSFELAAMITVLAFVPEPSAAMCEIARVLAPGGRLILGDLGKWNLWAASRRVRGWLGMAPMWRPASFRSASELRTLAHEAGLHVEEVCGAIYYPRAAPIARLLAPLDPSLGKLTTVGAAFLALRATKADWPAERAPLR